MPKTRVLMVCMGNLCRSPTAEVVLRSKLRSAGLAGRIDVASAGTARQRTGEAPDARAVKHAAARGYDLSGLRARVVASDDYATFDWMLAMDDDNLRRVRSGAPDGARACIGLLLAHSPRFAHLRHIPDPYFGTAAGFERVLDLIEDACDGLVQTLQQSTGTSSAKLDQNGGFPL